VAEVEVIDRVERRRKWSEAEKASLLAEVDATGGKVAVVARRHRISESLLYNWRAAVRAVSGVLGAPFGFERAGGLLRPLRASTHDDFRAYA